MLSTNNKEWNSMVSVQTQIEMQGDLSLANLSRKLDEINLPKEILKITLTKLQDELILELCGPSHQRDPNRQFKRAATTNRTLKTRHGQIQFKLVVVHNLENNSYFRPLLVYLGVYSRQRIVDDLDLECAEMATYLTYRDSKAVIENLTHAKVSKDRIHACTQKVGDFMNQTRRKPSVTSAATAAEKETKEEGRVVDLMLGDGTKVHGYNGKKNEVSVILGKDEATGEKMLLGFGVNESWKEVAGQFRGRAKVAVSDNESALRQVLLEKSCDYQACVLHCIRDVKFYLWQAGLSKVERKEISGRVETVLWTLRSSVEKHVASGDVAALRWRVDWALLELKKISGELLGAGLTAVSRFICNSANYMVTFARLAMKGVVVAFCSNLVERLMGEVAKRVKHKWMHWSERGLENLLNILLARYCNRRIYEVMKEKYLSPSDTIIKITTT
jgi:hypothetical protein